MTVLTVHGAGRDHGREEGRSLVVDVDRLGRALPGLEVHGRDPVGRGLVEQDCAGVGLPVRVVPVQGLEKVAVRDHGEPIVRASGELDRRDGPAGTAVDVAEGCGTQEVVVGERPEEILEPVAKEGTVRSGQG